MTRRALVGVFMLAMLWPASASLAAGPHVAPGAPKDTPEDVRGKAEVDAFEAALKPAMDTARKTYPDARALPPRPPATSQLLRGDEVAGRSERRGASVRRGGSHRRRPHFRSYLERYPG